MRLPITSVSYRYLYLYPTNTVFLWHPRISTSKLTSIRALVFAGRRRVTDRQIHHATGSSVAIVRLSCIQFRRDVIMRHQCRDGMVNGEASQPTRCMLSSSKIMWLQVAFWEDLGPPFRRAAIPGVRHSRFLINSKTGSNPTTRPTDPSNPTYPNPNSNLNASDLNSISPNVDPNQNPEWQPSGMADTREWRVGFNFNP